MPVKLWLGGAFHNIPYLIVDILAVAAPCFLYHSLAFVMLAWEMGAIGAISSFLRKIKSCLYLTKTSPNYLSSLPSFEDTSVFFTLSNMQRQQVSHQ